MPAGRPTEYKPEVIDEINQYLTEAIPENMRIPTIEGIALRLGINRDTLYEWAKVHKEFSDTLERLRALQKEALIQTGIFGGKEINQAIVALLLRVNHEMVETERKVLVGEGGGPIAINLIGDYLSKPTIMEAPTGGFERPDEVQGSGVAQESKKDVNGAREDSTGSA